MKSDWIEVKSEAGLELSHEGAAGRSFEVPARKTYVRLAVITTASLTLTSSGNFDDVALHRPEDGEQFTFLFLWDVEGI